MITMHLLHSSIDNVAYCAIAAFAYFQSQASAGLNRQQQVLRMTDMAVATNTSVLKGTHASGFASVIEAAKTRITRYRLYRQTVNELSSLSNRELADLGLNRSMIRSLAVQAVEDFSAR